MKLLLRAVVAIAGVLFALTFAWLVAFLCWSSVHRPHSEAAPSGVRLNPDAERRTPYAVLGTPDADKPYVASIRTDSQVYHLRDCKKFGGELKWTVAWSKEEAEASGRRPCSACIKDAGTRQAQRFQSQSIPRR